ncbi:MAG: ATP-binding protein [Mesorhizobium sp.]|nr:MAG: ATP-binding protein [Mesorhizobium sp.]
MSTEKETLRRVQDGLYHLQRALSSFIAERMEKKYGKGWLQFASRAAGSGPRDPLDIYGMLKTMLDQWRDVFDDAFARNEKFKVRNFASTAFDGRNATSHLALPLTDAEALRYLDAMVCLGRTVKGPKAEIDEINKLYEAQRQSGIATSAAHASASSTVAAPSQPVARPALSMPSREKAEAKPGTLSLGLDPDETPAGSLRPWIEVAFPHPDVIANRYKQSEFAADLAAVDMGNASDDYATPENFFRITFLTEGLRRVLRTALERLTGAGGDPVLGLQTSFGGGKTHTMLALYHLAKARDLSLLKGVYELADTVGVKDWPSVKTVVFVGTAKGVDSSLLLRDGPKVRTLWGYIGWRLAGDAGLELVREAENAGTNPGSELMVEVFRLAGPSVILLDEVVAFARQLPDDRFEAFLSFIQSLTEASKMVPNVLLVGSLPESDQEAGGDKGVAALRRLERVFGRTGSPWLAAHGNETYEIVRRRLFQELDSEGERARDDTVKAFHQLYRSNTGEFPPYAKEPRYQELLRLSYPIHPELFERLAKDWSTLDNFQRTRGVLRFMANVVSVLWQQRTRDALILPARVPMADERVKASAIYPLDPAYSAVIDSEVDGDGSLPARMESVTTRRISQARAATRAARAVFLCSAPTVGQPHHGVTGQAIRLASAEPGDQLAIFGEALRELHEKATYLYEDAGRYWFSTQPTLNRLADERAKALPSHEVDAEIIRILSTESSQRNTGFSKVHAAPDSPSGVDEGSSLALVILRPASIHTKGANTSPALEAATDALTRCRSAQRRYRNTLIFVAADEASLATAREVVRKSLAWSSIEKEADKGDLRKQLTQGQIEDVTERARSNRDSADKAVRSAWVHILYAEKEEGALDGKPFEIAQTTLLSRDRPSIAASVYEKLSSRGDSIVKDTLGPRMLAAKLQNLWPAEQPHVAVADLKEWFASYVYLPKIRDAAVLESAIAEGVSTSDPMFGYADAYNSETAAYEGLVFGRLAPTSFSDRAVIIHREAALAASQPKLAPSGGTVIATTNSSTVPGATTPADPTIGPVKTRPRRFFGVVEIDPSRPIRSFESIVNSVVAELQRQPGTRVTLTLDIEARSEAGFPDDDVEIIRDNAKQLKFKGDSTGFGD